jgi:hypothetical protein
MSRSPWLLGLLLVVTPAVRAQAPGERLAAARALVARAESLEAGLKHDDSVAQAKEGARRHATVFTSGSLTVLLPAFTDDAIGRRIAAGATAMLDDIGAVPESFVGALVVVSDYAMNVDSVIKMAGLGSRARVRLDAGLHPDTLADDWKVATAVGRAYAGSRDRDWNAWLPWNLGVGWTMTRDGQAAVRDLMTGDTRVGAQCLAGDMRGCRLWFGLDRDPNPYAVRFAPAELRRMLAQRFFYGGGSGLMRDCLGGTDDACVRATAGGDLLPPVPAGYAARGSLLHAVRRQHGAPALRRALADTVGSLGDRLARATGVGGDSLLAQWRTWLLTAGGQARVRADVRAAIPALVFGGLLLFAAAGSGRWR